MFCNGLRLLTSNNENDDDDDDDNDDNVHADTESVLKFGAIWNEK